MFFQNLLWKLVFQRCTDMSIFHPFTLIKYILFHTPRLASYQTHWQPCPVQRIYGRKWYIPKAFPPSYSPPAPCVKERRARDWNRIVFLCWTQNSRCHCSRSSFSHELDWREHCGQSVVWRSPPSPASRCQKVKPNSDLGWIVKGSVDLQHPRSVNSTVTEFYFINFSIFTSCGLDTNLWPQGYFRISKDLACEFNLFVL